MSERKIETIVLGAAGYVGGDLLRLLRNHPVLELTAAVSRSQGGRPIHEVFPHLHVLGGDAPEFCSDGDVLERLHGEGQVALFSCLPHGESAARIESWVKKLQVLGREPIVVDLSADFRLSDPRAFSSVYGVDHGAPGLYEQFFCGLPDLEKETPEGFIAHPGCFTTAVTLATAPLVATGRVSGPIAVSAVTGSTGSGRKPRDGTHHPERHANLRAYKPLTHRHAHEMEALLERAGGKPRKVHFTPHSGPFARGIHATVQVPLSSGVPTSQLVSEIDAFYAHTPFVSCTDDPPVLKDVVGTNHCKLSVFTDGPWAVVLSVIDNLTKGSAGGGMQWMNRRLGLDQTTGLDLPGLGWN